MALPGLASGDDVPVLEEKPTVTHELQPNTEWRFEVNFGETVEVTLASGTAELFGTELVPARPYAFSGRKAAIYTWHGARLEVSGPLASDYVAEETPMAAYANLHFALEELRQAAADAPAGSPEALGPRVLVLGPAHAGKSALVQLLAAYAFRAGRAPLVANLDPAEGVLTLPGALSAAALDSVVDVEEGWGSSPTSGPQPLPVKLPLVYHYGLADPDAQPGLFKPLVRRLALAVRGRMATEPAVGAAGVVIDSAAGMSAGKGNYDLIQHVVAEFQVNVLVVLGSERLYSDLTRRFAAAAGAPAVVKLDRSGGCVERDAAHRRARRTAQVRAYFFGDPARGAALGPHTQTVDFDDVTIYRVVEHAAESAMLSAFAPGGDADDDGEDGGDGSAPRAAERLLERVEPSAEMQHALLAVVAAAGHEGPAAVRDGASVVGFVHVAAVDAARRRLRLLAPLGGRLPRGVLVWGSWPEAVGELAG